jgi:hypothetical protein
MFHGGTAVVMLGFGWEEGGSFFEFWGRIEQGNAGVSCLFGDP